MRKQQWAGIALGVLALLIDRASKSWFVQQPGWYWGNDNTMFLQYYLNTNMAFSLPLFPLVYFTLVIVVLAMLIRHMIQTWHQQQMIEFVIGWFIFVGAISNLYDRWRYGGVIDFIHISLGSIFNLADVYIVVAMFIWVVLIYGQQKVSASH